MIPQSNADDELRRRRRVALLFSMTAATGDVNRFLSNLDNIDWPGAWLDVFEELARMPPEMVYPNIRAAFMTSWRGGADWSKVHPRGINWTVTKDCDTRRDVLVAALKNLMPSYAGAEPPIALYRGQSLADHQRGSYGVWWTPYPHIAEWFARSEILVSHD